MKALWMAILLLASVAAAQTPTFEVASIKEHVFNGPGGGCSRSSLSGARVTISCSSLRILIMRAYDVKDYQITGGPSWLAELGDTAYDISATAPGGAPLSAEQVNAMLQTLLAERFQVKLHRETKDLPVYALAPGKDGPKLKDSPAEAKSGIRFTMGGIRGSLTATKESMRMFALYLSNEVGRPVLDRTGLNGDYDFTLEYTRDQPQLLPGRPAPDASIQLPDPSGPSIFTAVREQLGLKLDSQRSPIDLLVIDHAARPSEN